MNAGEFLQAKQYLAKVLPWPNDGEAPSFVNVHWTFKGAGYERAAWSGRAVRSIQEAVSAIAFALKLPDTRDVYVCMSTQREAQEAISQKGHKYYKPIRLQTNSVALKSFFLDLDAKGIDKNSYASVTDAISGLAAFIKATGLPRPSTVVSSGGGLHVYWVVSARLTPDEWKPLAYALAEATKRHGLKCDTQCTIDCARVLRIPDTFHRKTETPIPVKLISINDFDYSLERIEKALEPYKVAVPKAAGGVLEDASLFGTGPAKALLAKQADLLSAGIEQNKAPPVDLDSVATECGFIREAISTGGATYANPLWNLTTLIATFTQGARADAHRMGNHHPGYSQVSTDELYDRKVREKEEKNLGWPACHTISGSGCKSCATCPHLSAARSPLNLARPVAVAPPATQPIPAAPQPVTNDLPQGYARDFNGLVCEVLVAEDGAQTLRPLHDYRMDDPWIQTGDTTGVLHFNTTIRHQERHIMLPFNVVGTNDMRFELHSQDMLLPVGPKAIERIGRFFVSWIRLLQESRDSVRSRPFGWSMNGNKIEGFVYGGSLWSPTGSKQAPVGDTVIARHYEPVGDIEPWIEAAKIITDQSRPALEAIVATAFAAPLVRFTGEAGVLLSAYSSGSGVGKTTAQKVAQAVWGDPILATQSLDDTINSVMNKVGQIQALPLYWDEIKTQDQTKKFVQITFQVTQGKEKSRLTSRVAQREPGKWQTLVVSCSNESVLDYVRHHLTTSDAGLYRVFEFEVLKANPGDKGQLVSSDVSVAIAKLNDNHGIVGKMYAQFLGGNHLQVAKDIKEEMRQINVAHSCLNEERYWVLLLASINVAMHYANQLTHNGHPVITFDQPMVRAFMLDKLRKMRGLRAESTSDMSDKFNVTAILGQFFNACRERHLLITNRVHISAGPPPVGSIKVTHDASRVTDVWIHVGKDQKTMRFSAGAFYDWLIEKNMNRTNVTKALAEKLQAKKFKGVLAGGTTLRWLSPDWVYEIDMRNDPALLDYCN